MVSTYPGGNFPSIPTPQPPKEISARHEDHIGEEYIYCGVRYKVYAPETTPPVDHVPAAPDARIRDLVTKISKAVDVSIISLPCDRLLMLFVGCQDRLQYVDGHPRQVEHLGYESSQ
jgi:hypothetical protein